MGWWFLSCVLCFLGGGLLLPWLAAALPRWHRQAWRRWWARKSRAGARGGRPRISDELISEIERISYENPTWGAPRIHGELLKLGFSIAQSTVSKYMPRRRHRGGGVPRWLEMLRGQANAAAAIDMLHVPGLMFQNLYAVVVIGHGRRKILHVGATDHPTAMWLARQITEAFPWDEAPTYLVRDNDRAYGLRFRWRLKAMGIRDRPITPYSPWQNGYVERLIGSIRRECLDNILILDAPHLCRVLKAYADYYNNDRTHLSLNKDSPNGRAVEAVGKIISEPVLGGLHHRYRRV